METKILEVALPLPDIQSPSAPWEWAILGSRRCSQAGTNLGFHEMHEKTILLHKQEVNF